ncbi:hypothetical protein APA_2089 [Pseudanabaena sp. lw0831]|nr:hypothetical protein [Pseudanabaena sp. lw0831]GBO54141.1 hypothetical protein APA_2089 [Pseudanabaena sp. lw0831]
MALAEAYINGLEIPDDILRSQITSINHKKSRGSGYLKFLD